MSNNYTIDKVLSRFIAVLNSWPSVESIDASASTAGVIHGGDGRSFAAGEKLWIPLFNMGGSKSPSKMSSKSLSNFKPESSRVESMIDLPNQKENDTYKSVFSFKKKKTRACTSVTASRQQINCECFRLQLIIIQS